MTATEPLLGPRFRQALDLAIELHGSQLRKGTEVPYIAHLLGVCATVLEHGRLLSDTTGGLLAEGYSFSFRTADPVVVSCAPRMAASGARSINIAPADWSVKNCRIARPRKITSAAEAISVAAQRGPRGIIQRRANIGTRSRHDRRRR